jgi:predicted peptidase
MLKMFKVLAVASLAICGLAACNGARDTAANMLDTDKTGKGFVKKTNARGRDYALFVPKGADLKNPTKKYPMIVFLHGVGEGGSDIKAPLRVGLAPFVADKAETFDFFVLIPQSSDGNWNENSDAAKDVIDAISATIASYPVDADRVSLTGLSTGGYGTWAIGAKNSGVFAALVPMASNSACTDAGAVKTLAGMNIWAIENSGDPFSGMNSNQRTVAAINAVGAKNLRHDEYQEGGHNCWDRAYGDGAIFGWLRTMSRKKAATPATVTPATKASSSVIDSSRVPPAAAPKAEVKLDTNGTAVVPPGPKTPY